MKSSFGVFLSRYLSFLHISLGLPTVSTVILCRWSSDLSGEDAQWTLFVFQFTAIIGTAYIYRPNSYRHLLVNLIINMVNIS